MIAEAQAMMADAFRDLEGPLYEAKDHVNALWVLCNLTLADLGHRSLSEEEEDAFVHLIGEAVDANRRLTEEWNKRWSEAVQLDNAAELANRRKSS
ncbi:hypothetical protein [Consotaella salsifontis]|uniref:Uncharacterized protein n=1 Tax=Consotaella salsifontis TaxID=1365950 RepID=A0A1T4SDT6_9HYPH|nr:hypothetical protein [Consotaella salsifontis]SKA26460.1 hypothetical protein SAMN05428963_11081 [Consotaella salsifontis]